MSTDLAKPAGTSLKSLAREIQDEHLMCEQAAESAVEHAIKAGELLIEAKAQVEHGEWMGWLEANFPSSQWVANSYMRLSKEREQIGDASTISAALAELAEPRPEPAVATTSEEAAEKFEEAFAPVRESVAAEADDEEPEEVTGEIVEGEWDDAIPAAAEILSDNVDPDADSNVRTVLVRHLFSAAYELRSLRKRGAVLQSRDKNDRRSLIADIDRTISLLTEIREEVTE